MPEAFRPSGLRWCGSGAHEVLLLPHAWGGLGISNSQTIRTIAWAADVRQDRTLPENGTAANRGRQKLRFQTLHIAELGTFRRLTLPEIPSSLLLMCPTYSLLDIRRSD